MITEDYVSFETAKLLKEKGFDEYSSHFYRVDGEHECCYKAKLPRLTNNDIKNHDDWANRVFACTCPTLQMAMKWLREVHKYLIVVGNKNGNYLYLIKDLKANTDLGISQDEYIHYEEACEASINYCLENLI